MNHLHPKNGFCHLMTQLKDFRILFLLLFSLNLFSQNKISGVVSSINGEVLPQVEIFNKNSGQVYYDNQTGASDADDPATAVGDNSVIFVSGSNTLQRNGGETIITEEVAGKISVKAFPNPSNTYFRVAINSSSNEKITMRVFDLYGRKLEEKIVNNGEVVKFGEAYHSGVYFVSIQQGTYRNDLKLIKLKE